MRQTVQLTIYHLRENWGLRVLVFALLLPLFFFMLRGLPLLDDQDLQVFARFSLSIVEEDESMISQLIKDQLSSIEIVEQIHLESLARAEQRLADNEILLILYIPPGFFAQTMQAQQRAALEISLNPNMPTEAGMFVQFINDLAQGLSSVQAAYFAYGDLAWELYQDDQLYDKMLEATFIRLFLKALGRHEALALSDVLQFKKHIYVASSFFCIFTMLLSLLNFLLVQQEKNSNVLERQIACGIAWWQQFLARQLANTVWLLVGFTPLLALIRSIFPEARLGWLSLAICLLYWTSAALAQAYSLYGPVSESKIIAAWLLIFLLLLVGGCIYPLTLLPAWLGPLSRLSPAFWASGMISQGLGGPSAPVGLLPAWVAMLLVTGLLYYLVSRSNEGSRLFVRRSGR